MEIKGNFQNCNFITANAEILKENSKLKCECKILKEEVKELQVKLDKAELIIKILMGYN